MSVYTPVKRPYMKKGTRPYLEKGYTAVQGKTVARPYGKKSYHGRVHMKNWHGHVHMKKLTRPCTHSVHLLSSVRLHILACTLILPRTGRVYRIRTTYVPSIQDFLCFSQINTWMWKKLLKTTLTSTIENHYEKTLSCPDGSSIGGAGILFI